MKYLINLFRRPTPAELAAIELAESQRELLRAQASAEFYSAMVTCYRGRVARLQGIVGQKD